VALYRCEARIIGRQSRGKDGKKPIPGTRVSVVAKAAYRSGERLRDEQTGRWFNYRSRTQEIVHAEICAPENAPDWAADRGALWNAVERKENESKRHASAQLAREFIVALPRELNEQQQIDLIRGWCNDEMVSNGLVADFALHRSHDGRNPHAHILVTMRPFDREGFGKKARDLNEKPVLLAHRKAWEVHCNAALEAAGSEARVDCRSLAERGIDRTPQPKIGVAATAMKERGAVADPDLVRNARQVDMENAARPMIRAIQEHGEVPQWGAGATWWERARIAIGDAYEHAREFLHDVSSGSRSWVETLARERDKRSRDGPEPELS
jgi:MobA/MobL family